MTNLSQLSAAGDPSTPPVDPLRLAVAAYLARFTGLSRTHALSDLRIFLAWCAERNVEPLTAGPAQVAGAARGRRTVSRPRLSSLWRHVRKVSARSASRASRHREIAEPDASGPAAASYLKEQSKCDEE